MDEDKSKIITIIGFLAGILTSFSVFPEVYLAYKNMKKSKMQQSTLLLFIIGNFLWVIYAYNVKDHVLLFFASITTILFILLFLSEFIF